MKYAGGKVFSAILFTALFSVGLAFGFTANELSYDGETGQINQGPYETQGKQAAVYVLEFFSIACGWCQANASYVNALRDHFSEAGNRVEIVSVGIDRQVSSYRRWFQRFEPNHPILQDVGGVLFDTYGVRGTPTAVVLNCNLEEVHRHIGFWNLEGLAEMKEQVEAVRSTPPCAAEEPAAEDG